MQQHQATAQARWWHGHGHGRQGGREHAPVPLPLPLAPLVLPELGVEVPRLHVGRRLLVLPELGLLLDHAQGLGLLRRDQALVIFVLRTHMPVMHARAFSAVLATDTAAPSSTRHGGTVAAHVRAATWSRAGAARGERAGGRACSRVRRAPSGAVRRRCNCAAPTSRLCCVARTHSSDGVAWSGIDQHAEHRWHTRRTSARQHHVNTTLAPRQHFQRARRARSWPDRSSLRPRNARKCGGGRVALRQTTSFSDTLAGAAHACRRHDHDQRAA